MNNSNKDINQLLEDFRATLSPGIYFFIDDGSHIIISREDRLCPDDVSKNGVTFGFWVKERPQSDTPLPMPSGFYFANDISKTPQSFQDKVIKAIESNLSCFKIKFLKANPSAMLPTGADNDICSPFDCIIHPQDYALIRTGLIPIIPHGFELHIRPRFSLAEKYQVYALPGVIHARTCQEIVIILVNHSVISYKVNEGDAIAQVSLSSVIPLSCVFIESQSDVSPLSKHYSLEVL